MSLVSVNRQDPVIFSGSLRFNLDPLGEYSDEEIERVVRAAHLDSLVDGVEDGGGGGLDDDRRCRESGDNLSIGQRQLICLGRAMLKRSQIVVLDEATAAVDPTTNRIIQTAVDRVFRRRATILLISHRLDDVLECDRVVVMDRGRLVETGSPEELLSSSSSSSSLPGKDGLAGDGITGDGVDGAGGEGSGVGGGGGLFRALAAEAGIV